MRTWDSLTDAPRAKLELVKLSGDEGWHWGVLDGRKEIGPIAHARAVGGEWFWSLRWTGLSGYARTRTVRIARLMLGAAHHDWSDERIEQELLVRIEAELQA